MPSPHRVVYPALVRAKIRSLLKSAIEKGQGDDAISALIKIDHSLKTDPNAFGDPWYDLPAGTKKNNA
jgi:hypothetical protein